jgi:hypothetical protein
MCRSGARRVRPLRAKNFSPVRRRASRPSKGP